MDNYICNCSSYKGSNVVLKWQSQILSQQTIGTWDNIVIWEEGCCAPSAMSFTIRMDKAIMDILM
jgi:hypothetical protein